MRTDGSSRRVSGSLLTDPQARAWLFQVLAVLAVVAFGWFLFHNTQANLAHRGINSGFGFLDNSAGFGIPQHLIDYSESDSYARVFWIGLLNTLLVSVIGILLATLIGFVLLALGAFAKGKFVGDDPWNGQTLEWATGSPAPANNFVDLPIVSSAEPLADLKSAGSDA